MGFPGGAVVKSLPANAGDARDAGWIPGSGGSLEGGNDNPLQYSCLEIPWTEEPGGLKSTGSQRDGHDLVTEHACTHPCEVSGQTRTANPDLSDPKLRPLRYLSLSLRCSEHKDKKH